MPLLQSVELAHIMLQEHLNSVSYVIDATCGNGHDSAFIASLLDRNGKLFCFDIQEQAIRNTQQQLENATCKTYLYQQSHAELLTTLPTYYKQIDAIIFNLGFLPQADQTITTQVDSTLDAIQQAEKLLRRKGLLLIVSYPGHHEGKEEDEALQQYLNNTTAYYIVKYQNLQNNKAPILYALQKK